MQSVLPHRCLLCGAASNDEALCPECLISLPWHNDAHCPRCALPTMDSLTCGRCLHAPFVFDRTIAALRYEFPLDVLIQELKYRHQFALAPLLGTALAERARQSASCPDVLIPMPLHPKRLRERGFNQALELAKVVAGRLELPLLAQGAERIRATPPQVGLPWKERAKSVRGAFSCSADLSGKHVAVLDDVMTTGTSLHELSIALRKQGAVEISAWVVARTVGK
ncbi:MAG: ComF family protein [Sulfurimicrobium sp.]|nr:ComF family protein [Sulfurimicrobium sp.]MDZ7656406.1 ComF family protein [Sulfurimicrobium sp.]